MRISIIIAEQKSKSIAGLERTELLQVAEETIANDEVVVIKAGQSGRAVSVLLRGANDYMLDEMDRSLHDSFCVVKRVLESGAVVPGILDHFLLPFYKLDLPRLRTSLPTIAYIDVILILPVTHLWLNAICCYWRQYGQREEALVRTSCCSIKRYLLCRWACQV